MVVSPFLSVKCCSPPGTAALFEVVELAGHHLPIPVRARQHDRTLDDGHDVAGQFPGVHVPCRTQLLEGGVEVWLELPSHLVEALREPPPKPVVRIAERRAEVADDATALPLLSLADHFLNGIEPQEHPPQWVVLTRRGHPPLDLVQGLTALLHMAVEDREAEILFAAKVMEERARRHLRGALDFFQFRVVVALKRKQPSGLSENSVSCCQCPGCLTVLIHPSLK